LVTEESQTYY